MQFPTVRFQSAAAEARTGRDPRSLSRGYAAGRLVRLRRGVYLPTEEWLRGTASNRYALTTASLAVSGPAPILCRETALVAWGLEFRQVPSHVRYRTPRRSAVGSVPVSGLYGNPAAILAEHPDLGLRDGRLPMGFPDARHLAAEIQPTALRVPNLGLVLPVEPFDTALSDTLHRLPFVDAVVLTDAVLAGRGLHSARRSREALLALAGDLPFQAARRRMVAVVRFADEQAESVGESYSRALMAELGFEIPQLQVWIHRDGRRIARVDFYWPKLRLVGEFDGLMKYTRAKDLSGRTPVEVLTAEKRREDEIRAVGKRVVRWGWDDLLHPERFATILHRAGVPCAS
ncbi:type IV toxin-antitoxin system AbiEi family antitoxin domain-containing protein [Sinomonas terrae]|uniref:Type IV toxin-antitoxin system AbiEi family antitoxin domain-containing protein n=1 Tax=Sinomonas terrae TaxID=2908838 RepID=A0ABS9U689_9MICC|nr:type IV toxin-antitoxin system AbiEi family antitoxin domain-containing protein [Sinomonas terrae]MCH6472222.1 type IV toxin-antitoxin system AbiEi family antitoxin domain-containing protein [Sinomonas terrae]